MQVRDRYEEFQALDTDVLVITFARPESLEDYRSHLALPYRVTSDHARTSYRAYGVGSGSLWKVWGPPVIWSYIKLVTAGRKLRKPRQGDDLSQLGADFIIDEQGRIVYIHKSTSPVDRPTVDELLRALRNPNETSEPILAPIQPSPPSSGEFSRQPLLKVRPRPWHMPKAESHPADTAVDELNNSNRPKKSFPASSKRQTVRAEHFFVNEPFLERVFSDLARGKYSAGSWRRFCAAVWQRATSQAMSNRQRLSSFIRWTLSGSVVGATTCSLAWLSGLKDPRPIAAWAAWHLVVSFWMFLHLSRVRRPDGTAFHRFLWPNGLSFLRLSLAPLVIWPVLAVPPNPGTNSAGLHVPVRLLFSILLVLLLLTDFFDGLLARRLDQRSLLGRVLDPLADLVLLAMVAVGLYRIGVLTPVLLIATILRYPGALAAAILLYFTRGPAFITATNLGKVTTATISIYFALAATAEAFLPQIQTTTRSTFLQAGLSILLLIDIAAMAWMGMRWPNRTPPPPTP